MADKIKASADRTGGHSTRLVFNPDASAEGRADQVAVCALAFVASLVIAALGWATGLEALRLIGGYGVVFLGVGTAPFQLLPDLDPWARLTCAALVGFSVLLGVGAVMADFNGLWQPVLMGVVVCVAAAVLHAVGLTRARESGPGRLLSSPRLLLRSSGSGWSPPRVSLLLTALGTLLWLAPALWTHEPVPGFGGFLTHIGPLWYAGLVVLLVALVLGRRVELSAGLATFSFGLATTLTPALVYATPRSQTAGKQMQLTQYVLLHHHINVTGGIYQAFSSMFAGMAWLCQLLGIHGMLGSSSLLGVATYWPVLLVFIRIVELRFLAGRLLASRGRQWIAVLLVLLVDSLGADYFSPQSIGYVMAIGAVALVVSGVAPRPLKPRATVYLLILVGVTLAPTHELSPYLAAGALVILAVFGQAPAWAWAPIAVPALAWVGVVHKAVGSAFSFGALFDLSNFTPPKTVATPGLQRMPIVGVQSHALLLALLILLALGAVGFLANLRTRRVWAYGLCPAVGLFFIAINPYGNEGIFRATLFAIPWVAVLAMSMPSPGAMLRPLARPAVFVVAATGCLVALLATFVLAAYDMDATNVLPRAQLSVAGYLAARPPHNAYVLSVGSADNPAGGVPFTVNFTTLDWDQVATDVVFQRGTPTSLDLLALGDKYGSVAAQLGATNRSPLYIVWAYSSLEYVQAYGLQSPAQMLGWLHLLKTSPNWRLVDSDGANYLFKLRNS